MVQFMCNTNCRNLELAFCSLTNQNILLFLLFCPGCCTETPSVLLERGISHVKGRLIEKEV